MEFLMKHLPLRWCYHFKSSYKWMTRKAQIPFNLKNIFLYIFKFYMWVRALWDLAIHSLCFKGRWGNKLHDLTYEESKRAQKSNVRTLGLRILPRPHQLYYCPIPHLSGRGNNRSLLISLGFCKDEIRWFIQKPFVNF